MEKEEETKTTLILNDSEKILRDRCHELLASPLAVQKFKFFGDVPPKGYSVTLVVEKPDRISVIYKNYRIKIGTNGLFLKADNSKKGVTYNKKGRSSSRLNFWQNDFNAQHSNHMLLKELCNYVNPEAWQLLDDEIINYVATKGLRGSILAGKIKSTTEAMAYHIRYSMRGAGIDVNSAPNIYEFYKEKGTSMHIKGNILRCSEDPNKLLDYFHPIYGQNHFATNVPKSTIIANMRHSSLSEAIRLSQTLDTKIDLTNPAEFTGERITELSRKEKGIKELLNIWDGGPVLKGLSGQVNKFLVATGDLPF